MGNNKYILTIRYQFGEIRVVFLKQMHYSFSLLKCLIFLLVLIAYDKSDGQASNAQFFEERYSLIKGIHYIIDDSLINFKNDTPFELIQTIGDTLLIRFYQSDSSDGVIKPDCKLFFGDGYDARIKFTDWDIRPLTIPIKLRPKILTNPLQFQADVAIGPYFGYQFGSMRYAEQGVKTTSGTAALFCTPSLIDLDENNNDSNATDNVLGITLGGGFLLNVNENQFGIVCGWDYVGGNPSLSWLYQGRFWTSISMGFKIND
ncbi:MAG: hypothetical protein KDC49_11550 [Saprospiraceae bacterium]|nr:hypothetical protein [Saprospiraceae bacterium]